MVLAVVERSIQLSLFSTPVRARESSKTSEEYSQSGVHTRPSEQTVHRSCIRFWPGCLTVKGCFLFFGGHAVFIWKRNCCGTKAENKAR